MKIKIEHINNTYNYGSLMMAINTLVVINKEIKGVSFYVDTKTDDDLDRLKKETELKNIYKINNAEEKANWKLVKIIEMFRKANYDKNQYDAVIILGGDDISEYYGNKALVKELLRLFIYSRKIPIFLLGQTIGPFNSYRKTIAKFVLNKLSIYTRDEDCSVYLNKIGVENVNKGRDLAFLTLPREGKTEILKKYNLVEDEYITVVPSGLKGLYCDNDDNYLKQQINIINCILNNPRLREKKVVLLPHVLLPEYVDDRKLIKLIMNKLGKSERIIDINDAMLASDAREILGNGVFTLTGRMHAAVSTFQREKPAISLSYSVKYKGVIGNGLKRNDLIIEAANSQLWNNGSIVNDVREKINYLLDNYEKINLEIKLQLPIVRIKVTNQLHDVCKKLISR